MVSLECGGALPRLAVLEVFDVIVLEVGGALLLLAYKQYEVSTVIIKNIYILLLLKGKSLDILLA